MFILDLIDNCNSYELLGVLGIIKRILRLIQIIGPILGIIGLIVVLIKLMASPEDKKLKNAIRNWTISIFMLFLIPVIINLVFRLFDDSFELSACWNYVDQLSSYENNDHKYYDDENKDEKENFFTGSVSNSDTTGSVSSSSSQSNTTVKITKRFFIGDSRTVGMKNAVGGSDFFSCSEGIGLNWFKEKGFSNIQGSLTKGSAVIILLGVNDLTYVSASSYASYINYLYNAYGDKGVYFYFVSVNPTTGAYSYLDSDIKKFNNEIKQSLNSNIKYIDTYNYLVKSGYSSSDGLHYDADTYKKIYNYIIKNL